MARDPLRFARLLRTWWTRGQTAHPARQSQRSDLGKRATLGRGAVERCGPDWVDLYADPSIIGTERR